MGYEQRTLAGAISFREYNQSMAYFVTFTTYGTHLPGDSRGSWDRHVGRLLTQSALETSAKQLMPQSPFRLEHVEDRLMVRDAIVQVCRHREWRLIALHVRFEHIHGLVQAEGATPEKVIGAWKAYASRALKVRWPNRQHFWARGGDTRTVQGPVDRVIAYVLDHQGDQMETYDASTNSSYPTTDVVG